MDSKFRHSDQTQLNIGFLYCAKGWLKVVRIQNAESADEND